MNTFVFFHILRSGDRGGMVSYHKCHPKKEGSEGNYIPHFTIVFIMVMSTNDRESKVLNSIQYSTKIHPEKPLKMKFITPVNTKWK